MINEMVCSHYSWSERAQHTVVILVMQDALILRTDHVATSESPSWSLHTNLSAKLSNEHENLHEPGGTCGTRAICTFLWSIRLIVEPNASLFPWLWKW
jgi:hypothetical protein